MPANEQIYGDTTEGMNMFEQETFDEKLLEALIKTVDEDTFLAAAAHAERIAMRWSR